jgi:hypothetical protein
VCSSLAVIICTVQLHNVCKYFENVADFECVCLRTAVTYKNYIQSVYYAVRTKGKAKVKVKQSHYGPGQALRVPGG